MNFKLHFLSKKNHLNGIIHQYNKSIWMLILFRQFHHFSGKKAKKKRDHPYIVHWLHIIKHDVNIFMVLIFRFFDSSHSNINLQFRITRFNIKYLTFHRLFIMLIFPSKNLHLPIFFCLNVWVQCAQWLTYLWVQAITYTIL